MVSASSFPKAMQNLNNLIKHYKKGPYLWVYKGALPFQFTCNRDNWHSFCCDALLQEINVDYPSVYIIHHYLLTFLSGYDSVCHAIRIMPPYQLSAISKSPLSMHISAHSHSHNLTHKMQSNNIL